MKRKIYLCLSILLTVTCLAGCGSEEEVPALSLEPIQVVTSSEAQSSENAEVTETSESEAESEESSEAEPEISHEGMYRSELTGLWIDEELKDQRPVAIMVDNEITALDHYGVNSADVVYEIMNSKANGRITRLMCVVKDWKNIEQFGSVRSTRPTNIMLAAEYNAILIHDGGPFYINDYVARAYCAHLSGGFARFTNGKASEFTEYVTYEGYTNPNTGKSYQGLGDRIKAAKYSEEYNKYYPGEHFVFAEEEDGTDLTAASGNLSATTVSLPFPHNKSALYYNEDAQKYEYYVYNKAHVDPMDDNNVTMFKNLILQSCSYEVYDEHGYMIYNCIGSGNGYFITNGTAVPIKWSKKEESGITSFTYADSGEAIVLNPGTTYITMVPSDKWSELVIE
ncbi:MAG: DUF3048 domain-containing protein [Acetatifactor sp.]|nr:DUF3048 domain-containing protein [Acetatifactor sp.]